MVAAQAKELAQRALSLTASPGLQRDARICLARAHHACRELQEAQRLYTTVCVLLCSPHAAGTVYDACSWRGSMIAAVTLAAAIMLPRITQTSSP